MHPVILRHHHPGFALAGPCVTHSCMQDQSVFMRSDCGMRLSVFGDAESSPTRLVSGIESTFLLVGLSRLNLCPRDSQCQVECQATHELPLAVFYILYLLVDDT